MSDSNYPHGIDYVWLACDADHHVAAFITAGAGPVPTAVLRSEHPEIEDAESRVYTLEKISAARLLISVPWPDDFIALAERGFFVYDWCDVHRTSRKPTNVYECVSIPTFPVSADRLPADLARISAVVTFNSVSFEHAMAIDVRAHAECSEAE